MRFGASAWLWGSALAALVAVVLIVQGFRLARAKRAFGTPELIDALVTEKTSLRRTIRGVLLVLAVLLAAFAAAAPQYGRGTRVLPATNLDVVLVLDYSKSMYAKDVSPSRMKRAKVDVARLIGELGGARFGAVAFAGDTMAFPVTSDGAAIAQFFRGLEPIDMPIGGTSIARALETARELLARDPLSVRHERVIVLVTDGEDLEGDPAEVAARIAADGTRIEVVQIGGRTPEPMYEVDENGKEVGLRRDRDGQLMTTFLTAEGEAQLEKVASAGGGHVVRAEKGEVGIDTITERLQKLMTEELSERVETVYADVYEYPLGAAVILLFLDVLLSLGAKRKLPVEPPRGVQRRRVPSRMRQTAVLLAFGTLGCAEFDQLFIRESPIVNEAIQALGANEQKAATELLTKYLETGACDAGVIGAGERARRLGDASLDLGLALAGAYPKSGKATPTPAPGSSAAVPGLSAPLPGGPAPGGPGAAPPSGLLAPDPDHPVDPELSARIDCALRVLSPIAENTDLPSDLRARAHYLMGNLELSRNGFQPAIDAYDRAIVLAPGLPEKTGDAIGRDIAHNRALAQRRQQEEEERKKQEEEQKKDQGEQKDEQEKDPADQEQQDQKDEGQDQKDQEQDQKDQSQDQKDQDQKDQGSQDPKGQDQKDQNQKGQDSGQEPSADAGGQQPQPGQDSADTKPGDGQEQPASAQGQKGAPAASQDARILDRLEQAPTLQQHDAKQKARTLRLRPTMEDK